MGMNGHINRGSEDARTMRTKLESFQEEGKGGGKWRSWEGILKIEKLGKFPIYESVREKIGCTGKMFQEERK